MKKVLLFLGILCVGGVLLFTFLLPQKPSQKITIPFITTPTPVMFSPPQANGALTLLGVYPPNGATGVLPNESIIFTFNRPVATASVSLAIFPDVPFTFSSRLNMLIASPEATYSPNIIYGYRLFDSKGKSIVQASFSAGTSPNPILPLTGRFPNLDTISNASQRQNYPDVYLAGFVPYQDGDFSVSSQFSASPSGHYVFLVTPISANAKGGFLSWLHGLGLTDQQISRIEINYAPR